jgi:hypothetical protein
MMTTASVAEVQRAGVGIEAEEAVAIAQQLIAVLCRNDGKASAEPPYGPPTPANVMLGADGSLACRACETTPAVSEIAILLQAMLPPQTRAPGGLRYAIARALLDVDVPPFDSLADLSETLSRYERGSREVIIRRLIERFTLRRALVPLAAGDRRRHPHATALRRALREADARLYLQQAATGAVAAAITPPPPERPRHARTGVACVAAGLLLIVAGEYIDAGHSSAPAPRVVTAPPPQHAAARDVSLPDASPDSPNGAASSTVADPGIADAEPAGSAIEARPAQPVLRPVIAPRAVDVRSPRADRRPAQPTKRPAAARAQARRANESKSNARGVLGRLRLNWIRTVFTRL